MFNIVSGFWMGFWAPLKAIKMILRSPKMLSLVAIPLAVNLGLYILFFHYASHYVDHLIADWITALSQSLPTWAITLSRWSLKILAWLALAFISAITFTFVSGIISAPFNDLLSKAALKNRLKETGGQLAGPELHLAVSQTIWLEAKRMGILIVGVVVTIILGIIPFLQLPALILGSLLVAFEYFGYAVSQRSGSLFPIFHFTLRHPAVSLGFGAFLLLIMALPFTSIFYIPLAVVGGTVLYADLKSALPKPAELRKKP